MMCRATLEYVDKRLLECTNPLPFRPGDVESNLGDPSLPPCNASISFSSSCCCFCFSSRIERKRVNFYLVVNWKCGRHEQNANGWVLLCPLLLAPLRQRSILEHWPSYRRRWPRRRLAECSCRKVQELWNKENRSCPVVIRLAIRSLGT